MHSPWRDHKSTDFPGLEIWITPITNHFVLLFRDFLLKRDRFRPVTQHYSQKQWEIPVEPGLWDKGVYFYHDKTGIKEASQSHCQVPL